MNKQDLTKRLSLSVLPLNFNIDSKNNSLSKISSVLVILHYRNQTPHILLTKRASHLSRHQNEISFPGGKFVESDDIIINTAIRETYEEIGLSICYNDILGRLNPVHTLQSNFLIIPYVTVQNEVIIDNEFTNNEVAKVIDVPLFELLDTIQRDHIHDTKDLKAIKFSFEDHVIWGATARIISQLHKILFQL